LPQADALNLLAIAQHNLHTFDAALATNHRVLALHRRQLGERHALLADDYLNIGLIHTMKGRWGEAQSSLDEALRINRGWYGDNHPEVAAVYMKQSDLLRMQDQWDASEKQVAAALAIYRSVYPLVHPRPANALNSMAMVQLARNDYAKAENNIRLAYAIYCALFGTSHSNSIVILTNVGDVHLAAKRLDRAKAIYEQALQPLRANLQSSPAAVIRLRLAKILLEQRRDTEAKAELQEVHAIFAKTIGPDSPSAKVAQRYLNLAHKAEQERSR